MSSTSLLIHAGQASKAGIKSINQDAIGYLVPAGAKRDSKGIIAALADGISSSDVSQIASETAINTFIEDYLATSETWTVQTASQRVISALNHWLYAQNRNGPYRYDMNKGYVCTFSSVILKGEFAHLVHVGDSRIYRLRQQQLEQLTRDHRVINSEGKSYLSQALGAAELISIDYQSVPLQAGDQFILATDGVYEFVPAESVRRICSDFSPDMAAERLVELALENGSDDNLSVIILEVAQVPQQVMSRPYQEDLQLPFCPPLSEGTEIDGLRIERQLYTSNRSHVFLATEINTHQALVLKVPSTEMQGEDDHIERLLLEEWLASRIHHPNVIKPFQPAQPRTALYSVSEYFNGQTLQQWMLDNPSPSLETVRSIIEQIGKGLQAMHRLQMLHQDIRPANIMIDQTGRVKILDFGSVWAAGLEENTLFTSTQILGTAQYTAPEYFLEEPGSASSDIFSLGVICYQMLGGELPYGSRVSACRTRKAQQRLSYKSLLHEDRAIPAWFEDTLKRALAIDPSKRYQELSEFLYDLRQPNPTYLRKSRPPLIDRDPVMFWQGLSALLTLLLILSFAWHSQA